MKIGIIGGKGKMGKMFFDFFLNNGHEVIISDLGTKMTNEKLVKMSDAVLFSVPIDKAVQVIASVLPFTRKEQLLMDLTSIKTPAIETMLKSDCEVLGLHPLFGPTRDFKNQTIVVCKSRERKKSKIFVGHFKKAGMKIKESNAEEHDRMMAMVQGMTHFNALVLGHALKKLGTGLNDVMQFTGPIYKIRLAMAGRILAQDAKLYADIELENPFMDETLCEIEKSTKKLIQIIHNKDKKEFIKYFNETGEFFADFKEESMSITDQMIREMKNG